MSNFRFKQFGIEQSGCAMKVGTDGVLLGSWCGVKGDERRILDIGTGTGLLALMIAQRAPYAMIDAIDIDSGAFQQAAVNFKASAWSSRLNAYHSSIQDFADITKTRYDVIVSNPPYFIGSLKSPEAARTAARHADMLSQEDLARAVKRLMTDAGCFFSIFPYELGNMFIVEAALQGLYVASKMEVFGNAGKPCKRLMLEFRQTKSTQIVAESLIIESETRGDYTDDYKRLTKNFYLNF